MICARHSAGLDCATRREARSGWRRQPRRHWLGRRWLPAFLAPRHRPSISSPRQPGGVTHVSWMRCISLIWRSRWVQYGGERSKFKSCPSGYRRRDAVFPPLRPQQRHATRPDRIEDRAGLQPGSQHRPAAAILAPHGAQHLPNGATSVEGRQLGDGELTLPMAAGGAAVDRVEAGRAACRRCATIQATRCSPRFPLYRLQYAPTPSCRAEQPSVV